MVGNVLAVDMVGYSQFFQKVICIYRAGGPDVRCVGPVDVVGEIRSRISSSREPDGLLGGHIH